MMYVVVNVRDNKNMIVEDELFRSTDEGEALKEAREHDRINKRDKNGTHTELRIYPDGYEDMDWFDYDIVEIEEA